MGHWLESPCDSRNASYNASGNVRIRVVHVCPKFVVCILHSLWTVSRDSIVRTVTSYGLNGPGFQSRQGESRSDRLWGPYCLLFNGYRRFFPEGKAAEVWSWLSTSAAEVKNEWKCTSAPPSVPPWRGEGKLYFCTLKFLTLYKIGEG